MIDPEELELRALRAHCRDLALMLWGKDAVVLIEHKPFWTLSAGVRRDYPWGAIATASAIQTTIGVGFTELAAIIDLDSALKRGLKREGKG